MDNLGNECAFPGMEYDETACQRYHYGITLRDYFAGQVISECLQEYNRKLRNNECMPDSGWREGVALEAYSIADAMLKARKEAQ